MSQGAGFSKIERPPGQPHVLWKAAISADEYIENEQVTLEARAMGGWWLEWTGGWEGDEQGVD